MQIITGIGESEHVTSMQHRAIFEMVIGDNSYILNKGELLEPELQSNNALKIRSGMLAHHGCISEVAPNTYDEVAIGNGSQSMKRIDLVVARYTQNAETKVERTEWTVIQGQPVESNPVAPDYIHGNMQDGDLTDDCPVFEVHLDGIQVVEIKKLLNVLDGSLAELNRNISGFKIRTGIVRISAEAKKSGAATIEYNGFSEPPLIFLSPLTNWADTANFTVSPDIRTTTEGKIVYYNGAAVTNTLYVGWAAIGH